MEASASSRERKLTVTLANPMADYIPGVLSSVANYKIPPLGLGYLASYLRFHFPGIRVNIIDGHALSLDESALADAVMADRPLVAGFSVFTPTVPAVKRIVQNLKERDPGLNTVTGGPHVCVMPEEFCGISDFIVEGEGEKSLSYIVGELLSIPHGFKPQIRTLNGSTILKSDFLGEISSLPMPAYDLLPIRLYAHIFPYPKRGRFCSMIASRGCPFNCAFCANSRIWGHRIRRRSVDDIIAEVRLLYYRHGVRLILFNDDHFLADVPWVEEFCARLRRENLELKWICHSRADIDRGRLLPVIKRAGCVELQVGVESGSPRVLESMNKRLDLDETREFFAAARRLGVNTWATFIIGDPWETWETFAQTRRFLRRINPTYATFLFLLPFPGTKIFDELEKDNRILTRDWDQYNWHKKPVFKHPVLSENEIVMMRKKAYRGFYLRPGILLRYFWAMIRTGNFIDTLRSGLVALKFLINR